MLAQTDEWVVVSEVFNDDPAAIGLGALFSYFNEGGSLFDALEKAATRAGVPVGSERFDKAAEIAGLPYCRDLDLYVDRETKRRADALHYTRAHRALLM